MDFVANVMAVVGFFQEHWLEIGVAFGYIVAAARVIVKLTPTPADDSFLEKLLSIFRAIGLHID